MHFVLFLQANFEPSCYEDASTNEVWVQELQQEMNSIHGNGTWELTKLQHNRKNIGTKWVYKTKHHSDGSIERHKGRLVAKGFTQRYFIYYGETFAPLACQEIIMMSISLVAQNKWRIHHMDVKSAFLNGCLEEETYVEQPQGFVVQGKGHPVYKMKQTFYGLKQAPRAWYARINRYFQENGFIKSKSEPTLY